MKLKFLDSLRSTGSKTATTDRRSFLFKLGVGASATLASTATFTGVSKAGAKDKEDAAMQLARLQDEQQLRLLHQTYEKLIDAGRSDEVLELFTDNASVIFNGGVFNNKHHGLSRLYREHFAANKTGRTMKPAPGFELTAEQQREVLEVGLDQTAKALFPYSIQVGTQVESVTSHAAMARLHGEGVRTWWEGGVYELSCLKSAKQGSWLIDKMEYKTLSRADYREARSYAESIEVAQFSRVYPEDKCGPDRLV